MLNGTEMISGSVKRFLSFPKAMPKFRAHPSSLKKVPEVVSLVGGGGLGVGRRINLQVLETTH
jgi:hypothetical protein